MRSVVFYYYNFSIYLAYFIIQFGYSYKISIITLFCEEIYRLYVHFSCQHNHFEIF